MDQEEEEENEESDEEDENGDGDENEEDEEPESLEFEEQTVCVEHGDSESEILWVMAVSNLLGGPEYTVTMRVKLPDGTEEVNPVIVTP